MLDQITEERSGEVKVVKVNVDEEPGLAVRFGISSIPTILLFVDGVPAAGTVGSRGKSDLERALGLPPRDPSFARPKRRRLRALLSRVGLLS